MYDCDDGESRFGQPINGKILVVGKAAASDFRSHSPWACISIGCEPGDWPEINKCQLIDWLRIAFADIDKPNGDKILFDESRAVQIWDFVERIWDKVDLLLIHCLAGTCRSPAVAAAIAKVKYGDDNLYFKLHTPNMLVYRIMLEKYYERHTQI
jgi:predicted protein tyrosine phosphatase